MEFLDKMPYSSLIIFAVFLGLAPFHPEPHLVEKLRMLKDGSLHKAIDIFDLFMHSAPIILLLLKVIRDQVIKSG
jgi:hypothetical protein